ADHEVQGEQVVLQDGHATRGWDPEDQGGEHESEQDVADLLVVPEQRRADRDDADLDEERPTDERQPADLLTGLRVRSPIPNEDRDARRDRGPEDEEATALRERIDHAGRGV